VPSPSIYLGWGPKTTKPFEGTVSLTGFNISRTIRYRNSFLPILNGHFTQTPGGTTMNVSMTLHPLIWVIVVLVLVTFGPLLISALTSQFDLGLSLILPGLYLVMMIGFNFEANRAEAQLRQILGPYLT
jgi:hypothetical protein